MKLKLPHLLPLLLLLAAGCANNNNIAPTPTTPLPVGTFSGHFTLYHYHAQTKVTDSTKANLNLSLEPATGFKITGDTTTLHAGSYGSFVVNGMQNTINFADFTYPPSGVTTKVHLNGLYNYRYDGTTLQIAMNGPLDTLTYYYYMKKTGN
jgi:hypothetical protein